MIEFDASIPVKGLSTPRPEDWDLFTKVRHYFRTINGGAGQCRDTSLWVEIFYGWTRVDGVYLTPEGDVCISEHWWNILPGGYILDCTADQFGEGDDMRLLSPLCDRYKQYDGVWTRNWNPSVPGFSPHTRSPLRTSFSGIGDFQLRTKNHKENERRWWVSDIDQMVDYLRKNIVYAVQSGNIYNQKESFEYSLIELLIRKHNKENGIGIRTI